MKQKIFALLSSLFARMSLILLCGLLAAQLGSSWLYWGERSNMLIQAHGEHFINRVAEAVRVLDSAPAAQRTALIATLQSEDLQIHVLNENQIFPRMPRGAWAEAIEARLGEGFETRIGRGMGQIAVQHAGSPESSSGSSARTAPPIKADANEWRAHGRGRMMHMESPMRRIDVRLRDGQWVRIGVAPETKASFLPSELLWQLALTLCIILSVVLFAVRLATRPLDKLAQAANDFGRDLNAPSLPEQGPSEMRRAAQAFNRMQAQIKTLVEERSRALAAVSHDLRTPLTRLRLRTEMVEDAALREQMNSDLEAMSIMLESTLNYLRGLQENEAPCALDMNALLQSLVEDASLGGEVLSLSGEALAPYQGRHQALRRALQNLIDNALKYGRQAQVRIDDSATRLIISVEDNGPGVPPESVPRLTEPYYRPDTARALASGGVGLGLSIVKDIALLHGGQLQLANRPQGGFVASLILPRGRK